MLLIKNSYRIAKNFFIDKTQRKKAYSLLILSLIFNLLIIYISVLLSRWNNDFFTALQELNEKAIYKNLKVFIFIIIIFILINTLGYVTQSLLLINWRKWMTENYLNKWTSFNSYYHIESFNNKNDNPDQRISEDVKSFVDLTITLTLGLISSIISLISFIVILWSLSGIVELTLFNHNIKIHGYLVWIAIIYSFIGTIVAYKIGRKLSLIDYQQEKKEANFRFSMMRFRENSESIAIYNGVSYEKNLFKILFTEIVENYYELIKVNTNLRIWKTLYINLPQLIPILAVLKRFLSGEIKFGGLMQIGFAFDKTYEALSFLITSFSNIAQYRAVINRLMEFNENIENYSHIDNKIITSNHDYDSIILKDLDISSPKNEILIKNLNLIFKANESYLIRGNNGAGKSTLLKAIRGVWLFGSGEIILPKDYNIFFIPQKIYMPSGTLFEVITYPKTDIDNLNLEFIENLMDKFNISYLKTRLKNHENWSSSLSLGEQQKISIIRAIIANPKILIMDESTSAVTEHDERNIYNVIKELLPEIMVISIGHRESLKAYHMHEINI